MAEVTVLIPVLNGMPHLPAALDSILGQSLEEIVCVVVDGYSTDGTWEYLQTVSDRRLVLTQCLPGIGRQLTHGLNLCTTEFLARMDADDLVFPDRLEKQLTFLKSHKSVGIVGTQYAHFANDPLRRVCLPVPTQHKEIYQYLLEGRVSLVHASLMFRAEILRRAGGYTAMESGEDWDMFLRVGEISKLANLEELLYLWRLHPASTTNRNTWAGVNRIRFACEAALRRSQGAPQLSYEAFLQSRSGLLLRLLDEQDCYSLQQYRRGLYEVLSDRRVVGSIRLAWSAVCSPARMVRWIPRYLLGLVRQTKRGYA